MANFYVVHPASDAEGVLTNATVVPAGALPQTISGLPQNSYRVAALNYATGTYTTFSPATLFSLGENGFWFDPSDLTTMFQDDLGTVPVTSSGQMVGMIMDKSGRGNHLTQSVAGLRPTYNQDGLGRRSLVFSGGQSMTTAAAIATGGDKMQTFNGLTKSSDTAAATVWQFPFNAGGAVAGSAYFRAPYAAGVAGYRILAGGTSPVVCQVGSGYAAPITSVITGISDAAAASTIIMRVNGSQVTQTMASQGTGGFLSHTLFVGANNTSFNFTGNIYSIVTRFGANLTSQQIADTEAWVNIKTKAY